MKAGPECGFRSQRKSDTFPQNRGLTPFDAMQDNPKEFVPKPQLPVVSLPGSRSLSNVRHEHYCRLRSLLCPKGQALREAGMRAVKNHDAVSNATRLERRQDVRDRIAYLVRQEEEVLAEKRRRIEETLWAINEADIGDFFEPYEAIQRDHTGQPKHNENGALLTEVRERPKLLRDLSPEAAKLIEDVTIDSQGRLVPRLYNKLQANKELRAMLNIGAKQSAPDVTQLSDAELIAQLAQQAKELGISIDLNYSFAQPKKTDE
jgi:hypothetical protein